MVTEQEGSMDTLTSQVDLRVVRQSMLVCHLVRQFSNASICAMAGIMHNETA